MTEVIDQKARDSARDAVHDIANFRAVTEVRLDGIVKKIISTHEETNNQIARIEAAIKWAGGLILSAIIAVLGWAVTQTINANEAQKKEMSQQIKLLEQQEATRAATRAEILSRLPPPSAAEPGVTTGSIAER